MAAGPGEPIETPVDGLVLRFAAESDTGTLLALVRDLAEYEHLTHIVVADEAGLRRALFGEHRMTEALIAEYRGAAAGFALFFQNFSTFLGRPGLYLEDIFVRPALRGKGIGRTLFTFVARLAHERGCGRMEWSVLDWNTPAIRFYRGLGAQALDDWTTFRLTGDTLRQVAARFGQA